MLGSQDNLTLTVTKLSEVGYHFSSCVFFSYLRIFLGCVLWWLTLACLQLCLEVPQFCRLRIEVLHISRVQIINSLPSLPLCCWIIHSFLFFLHIWTSIFPFFLLLDCMTEFWILTDSPRTQHLHYPPILDICLYAVYCRRIIVMSNFSPEKKVW